ncbi:sugar translocase [Streptococcus oricebi]|uniref:Sugar translocase n=2 Tax=Streptococcus oricebi TaxID=1547447 RepID=A0ABS5B4X6_9STRE|nr:sugar translocase [Streptococcus oricebi]
MDYIVIPAYEPDLNLIHLLKKIRQETDFQIILVNDGSSPASRPIFEEAQFFATLLEHRENQGKGQALKTAFDYLHLIGQYGVIVTADADGQHQLTDILRVAESARKHPQELVLGVRAFSGKVPLRSRFGNQLTRLVFKQQTGLALSDTQTGLRAFTSNLLPFLLEIEGQRYEYEMNMLLRAAKVYPIREVPIETIYINDNQASHFRPLRDGLLIYKDIFRFALASLSSFVVDYLVYALVLFLMGTAPSSLKILLANSTARLVSSSFNYWTNKKMVFKNEDSLIKTGTGYLGLALGLFILDTLLIRIFYSLFGLDLLVTKVLVSLLLFSLSWLVQKKIIFKSSKQEVKA